MGRERESHHTGRAAGGRSGLLHGTTYWYRIPTSVAGLGTSQDQRRRGGRAAAPERFCTLPGAGEAAPAPPGSAAPLGPPRLLGTLPTAPREPWEVPRPNSRSLLSVREVLLESNFPLSCCPCRLSLGFFPFLPYKRKNSHVFPDVSSENVRRRKYGRREPPCQLQRRRT